MDFLYNIHPATVHFPIAFFILASLAGMLYLHWRPLAELRTLTWWPMLMGWLGTSIAILTGLIDQSSLPPQSAYRPILNWHIGTGLAQWVIYGWLLYQRWLYGSQKAQKQRAKEGRSFMELLDDPQQRLWLSLLLVLGLLMVIASGWNGGRLVYEWGVNVVK